MLRKVAQDIPVDYPNLKELIQNMFETNTASDGVGLAAPQIGKSIRVVVIDLDVLKEDFPEYEGFRHAFINAHIVEYDEESKKETMEEGCLSIPGLHERVTRPTRIHVRYLDEELQEHDEWVEGYLARVMQHEFDHLEGKMFVDRVSPLRKSLIMNKLRAGGLSPEAHLDLHGLNAQQAFETLRGFMRGSWYKGLRTILVVPGRGKNSPDGVGVLRGKLQSWLTQDPFKRVVLAFCTAQPHDGGPGSVYVLLRKYKKKGRVYWERMPADADLYE